MPPGPAPVTRWFTVVSLGLLAGGASAAMWRAPRTFPLASAAWWASTGLVLAAWLLVGLAVAAVLARRPALLAATWLAPAGVLLGLAFAGRWWFPATVPRFWAGGALLGILWTLASARTLRRLDGRGRLLALAGVLLAAPWGVLWSAAQRPAAPGTRPALAVLPALTDAAPTPVPGVEVRGDEVRVACGPATLAVRPWLTFLDSSRDGFWPGVSPTAWEGAPAREGPRRRAALTVSPLDGGVQLDAATEVPVPVHSHLNAFTDLWLEGVARPGVRFEAAGPEVFALLPFDYPRGRPARFATLLPPGELLVAQAADAEKGPFTALARGPLARGAPLSLVLFDGEAPLCALAFLDFTAQADDAWSPTAGQGLAVNVVQFGVAAKPGARPVLHLSLAETGIGAGRGAVTHAPGVYRNRLEVRPAPPDSFRAPGSPR